LTIKNLLKNLNLYRKEERRMEVINGKYKIIIPCPDKDECCGVCHYAWVEEEAFNQIHDRYYDTYNVEPSEADVAQVYKMLPEKLYNMAKEWGWYDTEVREAISFWMKERHIIIDPLQWEKMKGKRK
jgi:hypothetical protein